MRKASILFRFIDLGLVLLMAFLAIADIQEEVQVQLPGGEGNAMGQTVIYRLRFDSAMRVVMEQLPERAVICEGDDLTALRTCLQVAQSEAFKEAGQKARFVLSPEGSAVLQQLVLLLDLCEADGLVCTVES